MKSDLQIQKDVIEELKWEPFLNASEIGVAVKNGIVTLSGNLDSYSKKAAAEKAAKRVSGVKAIAEDIHVNILSPYLKTDAEIAQAVINALEWNTMIPQDNVKIKVEDGVVKLEGEVDWEYQRNQAKKAVQTLAGVRSVLNMITIKPRISASDINRKINLAFHRSATIDAQNITAEVIGNKVILRGKVRSFAENEDAENAAWAAPGVSSIENHLEIESPEYAYED